MTDCLFCKIVKGEVPCDKVYEDSEIMAFKDIHPKGPVHILMIPKKHYRTLNEIPKEDLRVVTQIFGLAQKLAKELGVAESGYRTLVNTNKHSGQVIFHVHWHLIGGKPLSSMA